MSTDLAITLVKEGVALAHYLWPWHVDKTHHEKTATLREVLLKLPTTATPSTEQIFLHPDINAIFPNPDEVEAVLLTMSYVVYDRASRGWKIPLPPSTRH